MDGPSFRATVGTRSDDFLPLVRLIERLAEQPLLGGNRIEPLVGGDAAYPAMIEAIDNAEKSITLCSYIFDRDEAGHRFVEALGRAVKRGVPTRVLIDDTGSRYTIPTITGSLRNVGVRVAKFMPTLIPRGVAYSNLRSHRKILVVDGRIGFTGGMNIRAGTWEALAPKAPLHDIHFRLHGPVVAQLQEAFAEDWAFTEKEQLDGEPWFPPIPPAGTILARGIPSGPDEDIGELRMALIGALSVAHERVAIVTPYFLPDDALIEALNVTALRGVRVDIVLPRNNNLTLVKWACQATLPQILERGCRVWMSPGIFDHSKLMVVDGVWSLIGSANWDPRSLRLNFEFNVECYDRDLAAQILTMVDRRLEQAEEVTYAMLHARWFPTKLRDGVARLFTPML
ncbi:MAG: phospholipase D-like domain-containing protein [Pirellulales bacterium]